MLAHAQTALARGFWIFPLAPKKRVPLARSHGFKDARSPTDPLALAPWRKDPRCCNIGINLGASGLCVLDFDKPDCIPQWLNELQTYKVKTSRGVHIYFRGACPSAKLMINGEHVGEVKSIGGLVLAAGSVHESGAVYTVADGSDVRALPPEVMALLNESAAQTAKQPVSASPNAPIPHGQHYNTLFRMGSAYRGKGLDQHEIEVLLVDTCEKRCVDYGYDYRVMCRDIAASVMRYTPNAQGGGARAFLGVSPQRIECTRCHELNEPAQLKWHKIIDRKGVKQQPVPLCLVCRQELTAMNTTFCHVKKSKGRMLDNERWCVWRVFISLPKRWFLSLPVDEQESYTRPLCDKALGDGLPG